MRASLRTFAAIIVALALIALAGAARGEQARPGPTLHNSSSTSAEAPDVRLMPIGDSIGGAGLGSPDGCGYRTEVQRLMDTAAVGVTWTGDINGTGVNDCKLRYGHFGPTVQNLRSNVVSWLNADNPDVVLVLIGTRNAAGEGAGMTGFQVDYQNLINNILSWNSTVRVVVAWVPYSVGSWSANEVTVNTAIGTAVAAFAPYPASSRLRLVVDTGLYPCWWLGDGLHPADYTPIGRWFYTALADLYGLPPVPLNSYFFGAAVRPGIERAPTACP